MFASGFSRSTTRPSASAQRTSPYGSRNPLTPGPPSTSTASSLPTTSPTSSSSASKPPKPSPPPQNKSHQRPKPTKELSSRAQRGICCSLRSCFVGRGFSRDITDLQEMGLQPLKHAHTSTLPALHHYFLTSLLPLLPPLLRQRLLPQLHLHHHFSYALP